MVLPAGTTDSPESALALETLCRNYSLPIYTYVRRRGPSRHDAEDLSQAFFARLLARKDSADVTPGKGKFRSFLPASLQHFMANEWDKARAQKRGGGCIISIRARPRKGYGRANHTRRVRMKCSIAGGHHPLGTNFDPIAAGIRCRWKGRAP
jgi:DNA-directed RNA polymerase specialized sigma24 family protein